MAEAVETGSLLQRHALTDAPAAIRVICCAELGDIELVYRAQ